MSQTFDIESRVRALLETAGLQDLSPDELAIFVRMYPKSPETADSLCVPGVEYEEMALRFDRGA